MGKALMICGDEDRQQASGNFLTLIGFTGISTVDANSWVSATEACTFSKLGVNIWSGGSGTNTFQFRKNGINGNEKAERAGIGSAEDTTNTDVLAANDTFNIAYTDTGTDSSAAWIKANVEFSSGYGSFQGASGVGGVVFDVANATQFISLSGELDPDGTVTEANAAFKARGYSTFEALQVRVTANARTNTSTFNNRINGAAGTGSVAFASGATGLVTSTGLNDAITDGQTINASITLGSGVQDLTVTFVCATLKSTASKQDIWISSDGTSRTASATAHYLPIGGSIGTLADLTEANARVKPGFAGVASNLRCYLSANSYTGTGATEGTLKLMQNGVAVMTTAITASGGAAWYENTTDTVTFDDNDEFSFEFDEGAAGSITIQMVGVTFAPTPASLLWDPLTSMRHNLVR